MATKLIQNHAFYYGDDPSLFVTKSILAANPLPKAVAMVFGPGPQETMRLHWGIRQLSQKISESHASCFRFDYQGTGDSTGDLESIGLTEWITDGRGLYHYIRQTFPTIPIILIGFRLGGLIASKLAQETDIHHLILVDPVWDGKHYLEFLAKMHQAMMTESTDAAPLPESDSRKDQYLGYIYGQKMNEELKSALIDLDHVKASQITLIESQNTEGNLKSNKAIDRFLSGDQIVVDDPWKLRLQAFPQRTIEMILKIIEGIQ